MQHGAEVTLYPGRFKQLALAGLCGVFTAIGVLMVREDVAVGWFVAGCFALGTLVFLVQLLPGASYLRLTEDEMIFRALFRTTRLRWDHIEGFGTGKIGGNQMVVFNLSDDAPGSKTGRRWSAALTGVDAALPDTYGRRAEDLAQLLTDWKNGNRRFDA